MMSLLNAIRYNSSGIAMKCLKMHHLRLGNNCLFPLFHKQNLKWAVTAEKCFITSGTSAVSSNSNQSILNHSQSAIAPSRNMSADHSHSKIWTAERFLSAGLIGILPLALAFPSPALDYLVALSLTVHVHWGVEAIVVDYVRPSIVGATISKAAVVGVYALSVLTLGGLFYFNYSDVGLCHAIRMLWKL